MSKANLLQISQQLDIVAYAKLAVQVVFVDPYRLGAYLQNTGNFLVHQSLTGEMRNFKFSWRKFYQRQLQVFGHNLLRLDRI